ncbi:hypothetical protein LR48_Vigan08g097300 [Vigna angularis]|uniref:AMP-dependent synthetase/ligase domain-containing protein n=1 Tax=Phaseolus angularis TaxID=3914 RepID=A0A0L9V553_PHAAN|nr:hypothetical protein LR48_Vigan08g097300 [Vigna angularis]
MECGRGILISGDAKSNSIVYTNARLVVIVSVENPLHVFVYGEHARSGHRRAFLPQRRVSPPIASGSPPPTPPSDTVAIFYSFGTTGISKGLLCAGRTTILMQKFDFQDMLDAIQKHKVNNVPAVPPVILALKL